jgi:hypothetical protein
MRTIIALAFAVSSSTAFAGDVSTINPYSHFDDSRDQLAASYLDLTPAELDKLLFRIADAKSVRKLNEDKVEVVDPVTANGPSGDWICASDSAGALRLTMRATSYSLTGRFGQTMAGEFSRVGHDVVVTNGPLKGMGVSLGTLTSEPSGRVIDFRSDERSTLRCREIL